MNKYSVSKNHYYNASTKLWAVHIYQSGSVIVHATTYGSNPSQAREKAQSLAAIYNSPEFNQKVKQLST